MLDGVKELAEQVKIGNKNATKSNELLEKNIELIERLNALLEEQIVVLKKLSKRIKEAYKQDF